MKKKITKILLLLMITSCFTGVMFHTTAKAEELSMLSQIQITQYPSKTTYMAGENLDLSDMILTGYNNDGTSSIITDYIISGYNSSQIGVQTVYIIYQNYLVPLNVTVLPTKVNVSVLDHSTTSLTLSWNAIEGITSYEVYVLDDLTGTYNLYTSTPFNTVTFDYLPGTIHSYQVCAVANIAGVEYRSELSDPLSAATNPEAVAGLTISATTPSSVSLLWSAVFGATGYVIYRSPDNSESYSYCGERLSNSYTDSNLSSGKGYKYKVVAYTLNQSYLGGSASIITSTNPAKMVLKFKSGDQKIRFTWSKVTGAYSYDIYMGDEINGFTLITNNTGNSNCTYIAEGLVTGQTYSFYAIAHRNFNGAVYDSPASDITMITMEPIQDTSTTGKYFIDKTKFLNSYAYKLLPYFKANVNYTKSVVIPGLVTTNVGGFSSTSMCPQGITFAEDYLLITAYDIAAEENSVIYVIDKNSRQLLTTLILPSKTHAGGISYDGVNVWVPTGTKISSIPITQIEAAVQTGTPYSYINYNTTCTLSITASFMTYYKDKLWIGTYNELKSTNLYSYTIDNKDTAPTLTKTDTIVLPTRIQGIAFTSKGYLILSRSCQLYKGLRGYIRQLDVYKPDLTKVSNGSILLGDLVNSVQMPSMNEDIAIDGSYLYVNFESGAFPNASYKMDRVCAFKLTAVVYKAGK